MRCIDLNRAPGVGANRNIAQLVEHPAYIRTVSGSIPDVPIWILFHIVSPEGHSSNAMGAFLVQKLEVGL